MSAQRFSRRVSVGTNSNSPCQQITRDSGARVLRKRSSSDQLRERPRCALFAGPPLNLPIVEVVPNGTACRTKDMVSFLADQLLQFGNKRRRKSSSKSTCSSSSSSSDDCNCEFEVDSVVTGFLDATPSSFSAVRQQTSQSRWQPPPVFYEGARVSISLGQSALVHWDLGEDIHMFAFESGAERFYVQASQTEDSYLTLTKASNLSDPESISNSERDNDPRSFKYVYNDGVSGYMLYPVQNTKLAVGNQGGFAAAKSIIYADQWNVE